MNRYLKMPGIRVRLRLHWIVLLWAALLTVGMLGLIHSAVTYLLNPGNPGR